MSENNLTVRKKMKVYYGDYNEIHKCLMPLIRIRGKHLSKFGFNVGDIIAVDIDVGKITISKIPQQPGLL